MTKKRRRFYVPFPETLTPPFKLKCWECENIIEINKDEKGWYLEEASEIIFDPPKDVKGFVAISNEKDRTSGGKD